MGWKNYVVIPEWKLVFGISRHVDYDVTDFEILMNEYHTESSMNDEIKNLTVNGLTNILRDAQKFDEVRDLCEHTDNLLIMWLKLSRIEFNIISEFDENFNLDQLEEEGYKIID